MNKGIASSGMARLLMQSALSWALILFAAQAGVQTLTFTIDTSGNVASANAKLAKIHSCEGPYNITIDVLAAVHGTDPVNSRTASLA